MSAPRTSTGHISPELGEPEISQSWTNEFGPNVIVTLGPSLSLSIRSPEYAERLAAVCVQAAGELRKLEGSSS